MKARIEHDWMRNAVKVWLYQSDADNAIQLFRLESGELVSFERVPAGTTLPEPTFVLPTAALEAIVKEASGILPPSEMTVDAMRDARETRDRLLAMVERTHDLWTRPQVKP